MSAPWSAEDVLAGTDPHEWFFSAQSRLIDELRLARTTAAEMIALAAAPGDAAFAVGVERNISDLLEDLGCCETSAEDLLRN